MKTNHPGELLHRLRKNKKITLKHLSDATGISVSHLSGVERGVVNVSWIALQDWAMALGYEIEIKFKVTK